MNADDFRVGVFDGDEHIGLAFVGRDGLPHVGSPHFVDAVGDDRAAMRLGRRGCRTPMEAENEDLLLSPTSCL